MLILLDILHVFHDYVHFSYMFFIKGRIWCSVQLITGALWLNYRHLSFNTKVFSSYFYFTPRIIKSYMVLVVRIGDQKGT
jgi:hypothetical protein